MFNANLTKTMRVMKLVTFFLVIGLSIANAHVSYSQMTLLSLEMNNKTVREVFDEIEQNSEYIFFYNIDALDINRRISIHVKDQSLNNILDKVFKGTSNTYKIDDRQVYISRKQEVQTPQQEVLISITGNIKDSKGELLPGVNISVKGTMNGTVTDIDGNFSLSNINPQATLVISYIGFKTVEIPVNNRKTINIIMQDDNEQLSEVVVVGYGTQKKINLTGAVSEIKGADVIDDRPITSLGQALQGQIPGLQVTSSNGKPGQSYSFNVRGTTSLNEGGPLILVDGVEMDPNIIPPEDIETISVLKDASSAAIYGARAAFGVVLITTKKGELNKKIRINYSNNFSWSTPTAVPEKVDPVTQIKIGGYAWGNKTGNYDDYWAKSVSKWLELYNSTTERNTYRIVDGVFYPIGDSNMIDEMTETGFLQRHNISVNGGSQKIAYHLSAGMMSQDGILIKSKDKYNRKNISLNINSEVTDWLNLQATMGYISTKQEFPYIPNGEWYLYSVSYLRPTFWLTGIHDETGIAYGFSPQIIDLGALNYDSGSNTNMQFQATVKPLKGLEVNARYTFRRNDHDIKNQVNKYKVVDPESGAAEYYKNQVNSLERKNTGNQYQVVDIWGQYEKKLMDDHDFKLMVGFNQESYDYKMFYAKGESLLSDEIPSLNLAIGNTFVGDEIIEWSTRSGFFRFNYDFKGKYLLELVGRYDGSSKFRKDDRFVFLPSASAGWRISEEKFMNWSKSFLDNLKIRASYGKQGNQGISAYSFIPSMGIGTANWIVDGKKPVTTTPGGIVSDSFTWETVKTLNLGIDMGFFNNKLSATLEWYRRSTEGMLTAGQSLPALLGTGVPNENAANLAVNGWELSFNWRDKIGPDFTYSIGGMLFDSRTKITKFENETGILSSHYKGEYLGEIWGYETDRLFTEDDFTVDVDGNRAYKTGVPNQDKLFQNRVPMPGDVKYKDLNNDGVVDYGNNTLSDPGDKKIIGNSSPRYQFGLNLGAAWKGIDLSIFMQGVGRRDLWASNSLIFAFSESYESVFKHTTDFWTPENPNAFYPRPVADRNWNRQPQTRYLQRAWYTRLKNLTVGYSLPSSILNKIYLSKVRFFVSAENLFTISGLPKGMDPEIRDSHTYPYSKEFSFGVDISF